MTIQDPRARELTQRIWGAFPVSQPAFAKLLGLLDIEVTERVPTAAVSLGANSRLLINPAFAERHCRSDEALVMLVLHELWHVVLGHTRLYDRMTPAQNWAFDAVINAQLCRLYPDAAHTRLFRELYDHDRLPGALLRPPEGWGTGATAWLPGRAGEVHRLLYSDSSASTEELFRLLPTLEIDIAGMGGLLGSHGDETEDAVPPEVLKEIRGIVAEWPMVEKRAGRDLGGEAEQQRITLGERRENAVRILRHALMRLAGLSDGSGRLTPDTGPTESLLPYGRDRKAWLREHWGDSVPLHRAALPAHTLTRRGRVQVYLDVSGSMDGVIRPLYAALASLAPWLAPEVQLFSTTVTGVPIARLRKGDLVTTWGTDIRCVTEHMLRNKVERALVVTDGWVGNIPGEHVATLRKRGVRIEAAVTAGGDPGFAQALGSRVCRLPDLD